MPENMIARLASNPMTSGNTNVAPNMATTCWAPTPTVLPQASRWCGATGSPGAGSTTSHLNIDISDLLVRTARRATDPGPAHADPFMGHRGEAQWCHLTVTGKYVSRPVARSLVLTWRR